MFRIGMKVVCVKTNEWIDQRTGCAIYGPKHNEVLEVYDMIKNSMGLFLEFKKYRPALAYSSKCFRPVQDQYSEAEIEAVNIDELVEPELVEV